jgi:diguanylate cyclase (GGDEF)-like protein
VANLGEVLLFLIILAALLITSTMQGSGLSDSLLLVVRIGAFASVATLLALRASRRGEQAGARLAYTDELTGLQNRRFFMEQLTDRLGRSTFNRGPHLAMLLLDLDRFKVVNDTLGHPAGDELLVHIARCLDAVVGEEGILARLGGDEFAVLVSVRDEHEARSIAEDILENLNRPVAIQGQDIWPNASIGIALPGPVKVTSHELMSMADVALYQAKGRGKGQHFVYSASAPLPSVRRLSMESELHTALKLHQFHMVYQPVVSLDDSRIVGAEALLRWDHPIQGLLGPEDFLSLAEETGLSQALCNLVIQEVCAQAQTWRDLFNDDLTVSINLSALQFQKLDFIPDLSSVLRRTGAGSEVVHFEITEAALLSDEEGARRNLGELQRLGFKVAIDDFGVGYSSLSYLQKHNMDILKLDQSFVRGQDSSERTAEIVRCIVQLAHSLGMTVTAEGVETESEFRRVADAGCDLGQGFYFSVPVPAPAITEMLATGHRWLPIREGVAAGIGAQRRRAGDSHKPPWQAGLTQRWGA